jgi:hypothetical protein
MINHPLQGKEKQVWLWSVLGFSVVPLAVVLYFFPLEPGILAFEFDPIKTLSLWDSIEKTWAAFSLGLDFLFLVIYSTLLSLGCVYVASFFQKGTWVTLGIVLAWGQWIAAFFDTLEDISLVAILFGSHSSFIALISRYSASIKFVLIISGLIYIMFGIFKIILGIFKKRKAF